MASAAQHALVQRAVAGAVAPMTDQVSGSVAAEMLRMEKSLVALLQSHHDSLGEVTRETLDRVSQALA